MFFKIYLTCFALYFIFELSLLFLQAKNLKSNNADISIIEKHFDDEVIEKSNNYSLDKLVHGIFNHIYSNIVLLILIFTGMFGAIMDLVNSQLSGNYINGILYTYAIILLFKITSLPFEYKHTFTIEEKYGFNKTTVKLWIIDQLKGLLVAAVILIPVLLAIFFFVYKTGSLWWLYAFCFLMIFQVFVLYLYPVWIAPLFNKFKPLEEGVLKEKIFTLSKKLNFPLQEVFIMDGSRRSSHGNAYFTGFGKNQRIVLFDTIVDSLSGDELLAVLCHEIGHKKLNHIRKILVSQSFITFIMLFSLGLLYTNVEFFNAFGFSSVSPAAALIIFSLAFSPFTYFLNPLTNLLQRKHEFEADAFANNAIGNSKDLEMALVKLHKENLSNLFPHPLYSFFHYSHPPLVERLSAF